MLQTLADWHNVFLLTGSVVLIDVLFLLVYVTHTLADCHNVFLLTGTVALVDVLFLLVCIIDTN